MEPSGATGCRRRLVDHSVHGLVSIRLVDAPQAVVDWVVGELGPSQGTPSDTQDPDITVTFTDDLGTSGELRFLDLAQAAFDDSSFYVLDTVGRRARIDFDTLGEKSEIVCESGFGHIPFLVPILGLRLLRKGHVLLHSSAFVYKGKGILATGWKKGGKTETLLPFMAAGAYYVSDEWTIVNEEDGLLYGLSGVARIWIWHFRYLPRLWARVRRADRLRLRLLRLYQRLYRAILSSAPREGFPFGMMYQLSREGGVALLGQTKSLPEETFGKRVWYGPAPLDRIFLTMSAQGSTRVSPVEPEEIARRMVASLQYERSGLMGVYNQFRFAFPDRANALIENARERELDILSRALAGKPAYSIVHPYPVPLADMYKAVVPFC